ncbi:NDR1/HIN1-like protein 6 [Punica granatum]|uniref:NDR1/HIN1-like protein 6 n=1 Tax=Punica granatum TaxID=22663 RepID=A0A6P8CZ92_PUNGR|nr:NDR1/HIN1-like protein 6 [Punica granatum]
MTEPPVQTVLQKPPGYRDPDAPVQKPLPKPPQRQSIPPSMYPKNKNKNNKKKTRRSCCRTCCCCFCIFILVLILLISAAGAIFYLWFDPKIPVFHFRSFQVPQFNVTIKSDGTYLDTKTVARVEVKNPNQKLGLYYGDMHVVVKVGEGEDETELGRSTVLAFSQGKRNVTSLNVETEGKKLQVADGVGPRLKSGFKNRGLAVKVDVRTRVGVKVEGWKIGMVGVNVRCGDTSLKGLQGGEMPKCAINLLKWINIR